MIVGLEIAKQNYVSLSRTVNYQGLRGGNWINGAKDTANSGFNAARTRCIYAIETRVVFTWKARLLFSQRTDTTMLIPSGDNGCTGPTYWPQFWVQVRERLQNAAVRFFLLFCRTPIDHRLRDEETFLCFVAWLFLFLLWGLEMKTEAPEFLTIERRISFSIPYPVDSFKVHCYHQCNW